MRSYASKQELHEADLSELRFEDMTKEEQAEIHRRFEEFSRLHGTRVLAGRSRPNPIRGKSAVRAWIPPTKK